MEPTPDKITLATPEQRQQTDTLYNAACKVVSSLAIDETQQLNTLAITRHVDHYSITWQRYTPAYHAAFVTAIATSHEGYTRQEWRDDMLLVWHGLELAGWQSVTSNTKLEERVEQKAIINARGTNVLSVYDHLDAYAKVMAIRLERQAKEWAKHWREKEVKNERTDNANALNEVANARKESRCSRS